MGPLAPPRRTVRSRLLCDGRFISSWMTVANGGMNDDQPVTSEEEIIRDFLRPLARGCDAALDLRDDAACLTPEPGADLVITNDTLVAGVHFFPDDPPETIGAKAAAVNVSDLIAKGAKPVAYFLSLALPDGTTRGWMKEFADGLGIYIHGGLAGGDLVSTTGPLTISITAVGQVPSGQMVRRTSARSGDHVYVSRLLGSSAAGLKVQLEPEHPGVRAISNEHHQQLIAAYQFPQPPTGLIGVIRRFASAAMDLSDGLLKDAGRMCAGSGVGMELDANALPIDEPVRALIQTGAFSISDVLTGGDDYQVLMTVRDADHEELKSKIAGGRMLPIIRIGHVTDVAGELIVRDADGKPMVFEKTGHDHF